MPHVTRRRRCCCCRAHNITSPVWGCVRLVSLCLGVLGKRGEQSARARRERSTPMEITPRRCRRGGRNYPVNGASKRASERLSVCTYLYTKESKGSRELAGSRQQPQLPIPACIYIYIQWKAESVRVCAW